MTDEISTVKSKEGQMKRIVLWSDCLQIARDIAYSINAGDRKYLNIYGIPRGGSVVAVLLSHKLNLPIVSINNIGEHTLIVDDISDSGKTLKKMEDHFTYTKRGMPCAVLYQRRTTSYEADYVGELIDDEWIVFPWEVE